uniref:18 kDa Sin3-associated polypeptide n=1 Tax=Rhinolophus ferrumequinum TaxID=59479 RepID=A0A671DHG0_RHIFE
MNATLKELASLVKEVYPEVRKKGTHFNFATVFMDIKRPGYRVKEIGSTMSGRKGTNDSRTLQSQKLQIEDYMDIAITHCPKPWPAPEPGTSSFRPHEAILSFSDYFLSFIFHSVRCKTDLHFFLPSLPLSL